VQAGFENLEFGLRDVTIPSSLETPLWVQPPALTFEPRSKQTERAQIRLCLCNTSGVRPGEQKHTW